MATSQWVRQPVVVVLGHVDSGKTSLLDKIRGTAVQAREAGGMTQHIGASFFPTETLIHICGPLLQRVGGSIRVPGLLVIDTPGHEAFSNLRSRGGSAADIAILVVDITRGFEAQTYESVEILSRRRVPFVVALNKIDRLTGWRPASTPYLTESLKKQDKAVLEELDARIYGVVGSLSRLGFRSEAYYRVKDFSREVAIVPVSAKTGEGIPELIMVLIGLTQHYLAKRLTTSEEQTRGIVLELREEVGLGLTANLILLDGVLKVGDTVAMVKRDGAFKTKVRGLFLPKPLDEMRDPRDRFTPVDEVRAAAGVKIVAQELEGVLAGSPLVGLVSEDRWEEVKKAIESEVSKVFIKTDTLGVIVKADTLGSLEAITDMLKKQGVPIRIADVGAVTRREVIEASMVAKEDPYLGVILGFNVKILPDAQEAIDSEKVKVFNESIIYNLIEGYTRWVHEEKEKAAAREFNSLTPICKFKVLEGYIFRRSNPAIFGVEVLVGKLRQKIQIMNSDGKVVGTIHQIQDKGKPLDEAPKGAQVAVSMVEPMVGRHIFEKEVLYSLPKEAEVRTLREKYLDRLSPEEQQVLDEIIQIRKKVQPTYPY
ncbi:MAG: translation initiation factor IF-2 [Thaumarchaeota archaeon]|nr:translation initiation factor IF-2 [Nitrososphaerota archaeon]